MVLTRGTLFFALAPREMNPLSYYFLHRVLVASAARMSDSNIVFDVAAVTLLVFLTSTTLQTRPILQESIPQITKPLSRHFLRWVSHFEAFRRHVAALSLLFWFIEKHVPLACHGHWRSRYFKLLALHFTTTQKSSKGIAVDWQCRIC